MARKATLKDIARETDLSASAVSQVLNGRPVRLSAENRDRILACAQRLGYRANQMARSLVTRRSFAIGLVIPDIENPFFSSLARHLEDRCSEAGYALFIANSGERVSRDLEQLRRLDDRGVDGIAYVPSADPEAEGPADQLAALASLTAPFVLVDRALEGAVCDKVSIDNELGGYRATRYLLECGHERIGCLANLSASENGRQRLRGYERALAERGVAPGPVIACEYRRESGYDAVDELLNCGVTAVFSASDLISAGVIMRLHELNLRVPDDLSLVSFDNSLSFSLMWTQLTSVDQDVPQIAASAFDVLRARIEGYAREPVSHVLEPQLVLGGSVRVR